MVISITQSYTSTLQWVIEQSAQPRKNTALEMEVGFN
jgi:hypothetical protein